MFKMLHTADLHFSVNTDKLVEVVRTTNFILDQAAVERPDVIVLAGDTVDQYDGKIPADSTCYRAAHSFIRRAADIAPVVIVRGTKSHDRNTPELFDDIRARFSICVASDVRQVALMSAGGNDACFVGLGEDGLVHPMEYCKAVFTLVPSLDKTYLMADSSSAIRAGNMVFKEAVHDLFAGFGLVNSQVNSLNVPTVLVTHGMLTGACFSSGQTAIGEDLEFGLNDLHAAKASYTALGHVHKYQAFPSNVVYSGSPARLNFGEQEEKGFVIAEFDGARCADIRFIKTPARTFCFGEAVWESHAQILEAARDLAKGCAGSDVRFRFDIPDEDRGTINRAELEQIFAVAGADKVKVEISVIPKVRTRAAGISRIALLPEKVQRWGDTVREVIPENVLATSGIIEGVSADELLASALASISAPVIPAAVSVVESHLSGVHAACDRYLDPKSDQLGLFR